MSFNLHLKPYSSLHPTSGWGDSPSWNRAVSQAGGHAKTINSASYTFSSKHIGILRLHARLIPATPEELIA
jgi:hypothetical protein